jgi:hypothetical protein
MGAVTDRYKGPRWHNARDVHLELDLHRSCAHLRLVIGLRPDRLHAAHAFPSPAYGAPRLCDQSPITVAKCW